MRRKKEKSQIQKRSERCWMAARSAGLEWLMREALTSCRSIMDTCWKMEY